MKTFDDKMDDAVHAAKQAFILGRLDREEAETAIVTKGGLFPPDVLPEALKDGMRKMLDWVEARVEVVYDRDTGRAVA